MDFDWTLGADLFSMTFRMEQQPGSPAGRWRGLGLKRL